MMHKARYIPGRYACLFIPHMKIVLHYPLHVAYCACLIACTQWERLYIYPRTIVGGVLLPVSGGRSNEVALTTDYSLEFSR